MELDLIKQALLLFFPPRPLLCKLGFTPFDLC